MQYGFIPDILRILDKYSLSYVLDEYIQSGQFISKFSWNRLVKTKININVENQWCEKISNDASLQPFLQI